MLKMSSGFAFSSESIFRDDYLKERRGVSLSNLIKNNKRQRTNKVFLMEIYYRLPVFNQKVYLDFKKRKR